MHQSDFDIRHCDDTDSKSWIGYHDDGAFTPLFNTFPRNEKMMTGKLTSECTLISAISKTKMPQRQTYVFLNKNVPNYFISKYFMTWGESRVKNLHTL